MFVSVGGRDAHANATEGLIREVSLRCSLLALLSPLSSPLFLSLSLFLPPFPSSSPSIAFSILPLPDPGASLVVAGSRKDPQPGTNAEPFVGRIRKILAIAFDREWRCLFMGWIVDSEAISFDLALLLFS